jgi:outer membrane protein OmpA-like peptidoglycan-associated protein
LDHLRLEKRLVLNLKEGTNFVRNSDALMPETKNQIDGFLSDLDTTNNKVFLVAGHTDSTGSEAYNYELGQRRAAGVARYLITRKGIDPLQVTTMSYGKSMPIADNATWEGRSKNRRVEIWVYEEAVTSSPEKMATR